MTMTMSMTMSMTTAPTAEFVFKVQAVRQMTLATYNAMIGPESDRHRSVVVRLAHGNWPLYHDVIGFCLFNHEALVDART
jgi:hypothetical protein